MVEIKEILERYTEILLGEERKIDKIIESIFEISDIKIKKEDIKIKNGIIFLKIKPIYKNEIFKKKEKVLEKIKEKTKEKYQVL